MLKRFGLKHTSPSTVAHLSRTFESEAAALKGNRIEALRLERELDALILKTYKLTPDELDLLRRTTPPRSPLTVLAESLKIS